MTDFRIELIPVPVSDVDASIEFYSRKAGFNLDHDHTVSDEIRFVQMTPPGSACSISFGRGVSDMEPGSLRGIQMVVSDISEARETLTSNGLDVGDVDVQPWGSFVYFADPDGNTWAVQQIPDYGAEG